LGALFLYHKETKIEKESVRLLYKAKGFSEPVVCDAGEYILWLYPKQLAGASNSLSNNSGSIFACGSLFYKDLSYRDSLQALLSDFIDECIDPSRLYGNYVLLFHPAGATEITLCADPAFIKNLYFDKERRIISTDFLAFQAALPGFYSLNLNALVENIITGNLITPDTYATEIQRVDRINLPDLEAWFSNLKTRVYRPEVKTVFSDFNEAVEDANQRLDEYFRAAAAIADEYGANIGLTGGFDSRLLLMHARRHFDKLACNSFWRPASREYVNAKDLAASAGLSFSSFEDRAFFPSSADESLLRAYLFFDGQVRSQNRWDEEFNLPEYNAQLTPGSLVGFHGCGGEQYRNADRYSGRMSFRTFIRYEWLFRHSRDVFRDEKLKREVCMNLEGKVRRLMEPSGQMFGLSELKRFQNEIWNTANRATRLNVLNQHQFYFAPFTEYSVSHAAYGYVPYLGTSFRFQVEMMRKADPELASQRNNYGFDISGGEPMSVRLLSKMASVLPRPLLYKLYFFIKRSKVHMPDFSGGENYSLISEFNTRIDIEDLKQNRVLRPAIRSFDFFLQKSNLRY
jgi:hypothetical protein